MASETEITNNRKRRSVVRASVTRLDTRVGELEGKGEALSPGDVRIAQQLRKRLSSLDADFRSYHFAIIDLVDEDSLEVEQRVLDEHDDRVADLAIRLQQLTPNPTVAPSLGVGSSSSWLIVKSLNSR